MIGPETYYRLLIGWIILAVVVFFVLLHVPAPYGRHTTSQWGPTMPGWIGWIVMELPSPISLTVFVVIGTVAKTPITWFFVGLWWVHYLNRSLVYPLRIRRKSRPMPIVTVAMAVVFNALNGFFVGWHIGEIGRAYWSTWLKEPVFLIGMAIFVGGLAVNWHSDQLLIRIRKRNEGYRIPQGGLFRFVSAPNYLGEIVEWIGFAVMTWSAGAAAFALWTAANLVPRALKHHQWYRKRFPNYPEERRALIPFIL